VPAITCGAPACTVACPAITCGVPAITCGAPAVVVGVPGMTILACGWKLGATGWNVVSITCDVCDFVHRDESTGVVAFVSLRTATHVDGWVRVPQASGVLQHDGHADHCPAVHRYEVHGGTLGHGWDCASQFWHMLVAAG